MRSADVTTLAGLSAEIDEEGRLHLDAPFPAVQPSIRTLSDLSDVLLVEGAGVGEGIAYRMYRGVCADIDRDLFDAAGIRHDVTVIRPGTVAGEFIKTYGHDHPPRFEGGPTYPEVYEVLAGWGCFLLQRTDADGRVLDVCVVEGRAGQKVMIPPGYGHVTINPSPAWLVIANLVATGWDSDYGTFRRRRGAAYYALAGYRKARFIPNPRYGAVPPLRRMTAGGLERWFGIREELSLYAAFVSDPQAFAFLTRPEDYAFTPWVP